MVRRGLGTPRTRPQPTLRAGPFVSAGLGPRGRVLERCWHREHVEMKKISGRTSQWGRTGGQAREATTSRAGVPSAAYLAAAAGICARAARDDHTAAPMEAGGGHAPILHPLIAEAIAAIATPARPAHAIRERPSDAEILAVIEGVKRQLRQGADPAPDGLYRWDNVEIEITP